MKRKQMKEFYKDIEKSILRNMAGSTKKHYYRDLFKIKKAVNKHDGREDVIKRLSKKKQYKAFIRYLLSEIEELEEQNEELILTIRHLENSLDDALDGNCFYEEFVPDMSE